MTKGKRGMTGILGRMRGDKTIRGSRLYKNVCQPLHVLKKMINHGMTGGSSLPYNRGMGRGRHGREEEEDEERHRLAPGNAPTYWKNKLPYG